MGTAASPSQLRLSPFDDTAMPLHWLCRDGQMCAERLLDSHLVVGTGMSSSAASANIIWYRRVLAITCCASGSPCSSQNCRRNPRPRRKLRQRARVALPPSQRHKREACFDGDSW